MTTETIETPLVTAEISSRFGALVSWVAKDRRFFEEAGGGTLFPDYLSLTTSHQRVIPGLEPNRHPRR